jgi:RNA polymerase sigma-70 factor (ECF subfamily)
MGPSDEELAARLIASKDTGAFQEILRRYQSKIRNWFLYLTGDSAQSDDLAQDTFITVWDKIHSYRGEGKFSSWIMKIAYNNFLQAHRKDARDKKLTDTLRDNLEQASFDKHEYIDIQKILSGLTVDEQVAIILCYAHGFSHFEISSITNIPIGTIKSHIRRGKQKILNQHS